MKRLQEGLERHRFQVFGPNFGNEIDDSNQRNASGVATDCVSAGFDSHNGVRTNRRRASIGGALSSFGASACPSFNAKKNGTNDTVNLHSTRIKTRVGKIPSMSPDYNRHRQRPNISHAENETTRGTTVSNAVIATHESASNKEPQAAAPLSSYPNSSGPILTSPLPSSLKVLLVESDAVMRKIIRKLLKGVEPSWKIKEAPDGEIALAMVSEALLFEKELDHQSEQAWRKPFDLIFIDQYLTSSENKRMLGTDTVPKLRELGAKCCICGLSSNCLKDEFLMVGANSFLLKPFPTNQYILIDALAGILKKRRRRASL